MINPIAFEVGPLQIRWYALCILSGLILAVYLTMKEAPRKKILPDMVLDFIFWAFPLSILGARFYYVAFSWDQYKNQLDQIFAIWNGGIAIYGGLISGALVMYVYSRHNLIEIWDFLDIAAPGVLIAQALGRWGNFFNQEAYGRAVDQLNYLPAFIRNQMMIDGSYRVPTFLYESMWNTLGFVLIMSTRHKGWFKQGEILCFYLIWYGLGRFVIEGMRTDSLMLGSLRVSQWLSVLLILLGVGLMLYFRKDKKRPLY